MRSACLLKHNMQCTLAFVSLKTLNSNSKYTWPFNDTLSTAAGTGSWRESIHDQGCSGCFRHIFYHWFCHKQTSVPNEDSTFHVAWEYGFVHPKATSTRKSWCANFLCPVGWSLTGVDLNAYCVLFAIYLMKYDPDRISNQLFWERTTFIQ